MDKQLTKEEILEQELNGEELEFLGDNMGNVFDAMNVYAKQESIGFNEWKDDKFFMKHRGRWYDTKHDGKNWGTFPSYTNDELYELYKQSINKQP
jgi:hypothetical protein